MTAEPAWDKTIGSVLPFPAADARPGEDLWSLWTKGWAYSAAYSCARAALAAILTQRDVRRLWMPAYICVQAADAAEGRNVLWYGLDDRLQPEPPTLEAGLRSGDAVLGVDYFGRPPSDEFLALVRSRPDVLWIEDRAQALAPGRAAWGSVVIYSPRKLVGVGDGGLAVSNGPLPHPADDESPEARADAQLARALDPDGMATASWYPAFKLQEAAFRVDLRPMSLSARQRLAQVAAAPIIDARRANWRRLSQRLAAVALWPEIESPDFAPLAFPIRARDAGMTVRRLAGQGVFCARHWTDLPRSGRSFAAAERLSQSLVSLPCDQRYAPPDMDRVADAVLAYEGAR